MIDVHSPTQRSKNMAAIGGKNTKPEITIRKALHRQGFRYRIHYSSLPGKPDLVFPKYKAVIQINGCFWHKHECHLFKWPSSNSDFWQEKIEGNCVRDARNQKELEAQGWKTLVVWECSLKGKRKLPLGNIIQLIADWIRNGTESHEIAADGL